MKRVLCTDSADVAGHWTLEANPFAAPLCCEERAAARTAGFGGVRCTARWVARTRVDIGLILNDELAAK